MTCRKLHARLKHFGSALMKHGVQEGTAANASSEMVSAFAQSNVGDTSPNIQGAFCQDTGKHRAWTGQKVMRQKYYLPRMVAPTRIRTGVS